MPTCRSILIKLKVLLEFSFRVVAFVEIIVQFGSINYFTHIIMNSPHTGTGLNMQGLGHVFGNGREGVVKYFGRAEMR